MEVMGKKISFNGTELKIIAIIAMVIDHIGEAFFPKVGILRFIGRLTIPIMSYFIAEGYIKTRNVNSYMKRLIILSVISIIPFWLAFCVSFNKIGLRGIHIRNFTLDTIFGLFFGLLMIYMCDKTKDEKQKFFIIMGISILCTIINIDGIFLVPMLVYIFYIYHYDFKKMSKAIIILYLSLQVLQVLGAVNMGMSLLNYKVWMQIFALCSLPLIKMYNGERGKGIKNFFYIFYPVHLIVIFIVRFVIFYFAN